MKSIRLIIAICAITPVLFTSCQKAASPGINYLLKASMPIAPVNARVMTGSIQWNSGYLWASEVKFEAKNNSTEVEYKASSRQKVDLFSATSSLGTVAVPPGDYKEIEFKIEAIANGSDPALQLSGSYTNSNGITLPVIVNISDDVEIKSEQQNVSVKDGSPLSALTTLNLSLLTTGVTESLLSNATANGGKVEISATVNNNIYKIILSNLHQSCEVEVDH